jgi:DNA helicase-2/ATP-dependent DNA helicase PcrA
VRALQVADGYPHFVGTIDAFLLRFVVRRFAGGLVNLRRFAYPVPDRDYAIQREPCSLNDQRVDRLATFRICADGSGKKQVEHISKDRKLVIVGEPFAEAVINAKKKAWRVGEVTHSDVIAVAWNVLRSKEIAGIVAGRFPRILVDEFQDTTGIRERCLRHIFQSERFARAFVVGDPDQCIMDFAGASPDLFDTFQAITTDQKTYAFTRCHRFGSRIAEVTAHLRDSRIAVEGTRPESQGTSTVLLTHDFTQRPKDGTVATVAAAFANLCTERDIPASHGVVLAWNDSDVQRLGGTQRKRMPLSASSYGQVMGAIRARSEGKILDAFNRTERLLSQLAFNRGRPPTLDELEAMPLSLRGWRSKVMRTLRDLIAEVEGETVEEWATRVKLVFEQQVAELAGTYTKLGNRFRKEVEGSKNVFTHPATDYLPGTHAVATSRVSNVHQVKGQEFHAVCVYVPADRKGAQPAEAVLLTTDPPAADTMSARRVLYVGSTRAQHLLVVAIPSVWIPELERHKHGRNFLAGFDRREHLHSANHRNRD